jgi:hypothetical protein
VVALVVKYADNIHKGFANSASIIVSNSIDAYLFADTDINYYYSMGSFIVLLACWMFSSLTSHNGNSSGNSTHNMMKSEIDCVDHRDSNPDLESSGAMQQLMDVESHDSNSKKNGFYGRYFSWSRWIPHHLMGGSVSVSGGGGSGGGGK